MGQIPNVSYLASCEVWKIPIQSLPADHQGLGPQWGWGVGATGAICPGPQMEGGGPCYIFSKEIEVL